MLQLVKAKFEQNPELAAELRATGKKVLAESGKHNYFANGLSITNKNILEMKEWDSSVQTWRDSHDWTKRATPR